MERERKQRGESKVGGRKGKDPLIFMRQLWNYYGTIMEQLWDNYELLWSYYDLLWAKYGQIWELWNNYGN